MRIVLIIGCIIVLVESNGKALKRIDQRLKTFLSSQYGTFESKHGDLELATKGPVGFGKGEEAKDFDDKYNAINSEGNVRSIRRIKVWTQTYNGQNICSGVQFFFQDTPTSGSLTPTDVHGGVACDATEGECPMDYIIQDSEGDTAPIVDIHIWSGSFIHKMVFEDNKGNKFPCGDSETGSKQTLNFNVAGKLGTFVYMGGRIWTLHGRQFISNLYATFTKPVN